MTTTLTLIAFEGVRPELAAPPRAALAGHALVGRVTLGRDAWLGAGSIVRADGHFVRAGDGLHLGRGATIHIAHARHPTVIGRHAVVGANAVVHACTLGDDVVVGDDAVVLDGASIGDGAVVEAGSVVFPRGVLEAGMLYAGRPARPVRRLEPHERAALADAQRRRNEAAAADWPGRGAAAVAADDAFVARTACLDGDVRLHAGSSIWYGCRLDARRGAIEVGARCNVQDNSVLVAGPGGMVLGEDTTIGHNVELADCRIGARCLIGIGSRLAAGTVVADDAFVAAGCVTEPGQVLAGGFLWAGQPARVLGELDEGKRAIVLTTARVYGDYARELRRAGG